MHILDSLLAFSAFFFIGVAMVIIFLFIYSKITPHNEWQLIKTIIPRRHWRSAVHCWLRDPLIQCGNQCGEYSRLFRLGGRDCTGDSVTRFAGVRLYMPALSEKLLITIPQQECLWEPPRWLAVFLTQLV